jgi:hypothetical protein
LTVEDIRILALELRQKRERQRWGHLDPVSSELSLLLFSISSLPLLFPDRKIDVIREINEFITLLERHQHSGNGEPGWADYRN